MTNTRRPTLATSVRLLVVALGLVGISACSSGNADASRPSSRTASSASTGKSDVVMHLIAYTPAKLEVSAGTTVTWNQQDAGFHTVTSGTADVEASGTIITHPDGAYRSGNLAQGEHFSFTFTEPGAHRYFCEVHPATMRGRIVVT